MLDSKRWPGLDMPATNSAATLLGSEFETDDDLGFLVQILEFERDIRMLFLERLKERYGNDWPKHLDAFLPDGLKRIWRPVKRIREQFALGVGSLDPTSMMDYLSFGNYIDLLSNDEFFSECIGSRLGPRDAAVEGFRIIAATRNEIAHGRTELVAELRGPCKFYLNRIRRHVVYSPQEIAEFEQVLGIT